MKSFIVFILLAVLVGVAYQQDWPPFAQLQHIDNPNPYLQNIPADTPLFAGNLSVEPMSNFNVDSMAYANQLPTEGLAPEFGFFVALYNDLLANVHSTEDYRKHLGLPEAPAQVLYLLGGSLVMKTRIENSTAFWAAFDRAEEQSQLAHHKAKFQSIEYREYPLGDAHALMVALLNQDATIALISKHTSDTSKALILGQSLPAENISSTPLINDLQTKYNYRPYPGILVLDIEKLVASLFDAAHNPWAEMLGPDLLKPLQDSQCGPDAKRLAAKLPKLLLGFTRYQDTNNQMNADYQLLLESTPEIMAELEKIEGYLPSYMTDYQDNLLSIGVGIDVAKVAGLLSQFQQSINKETFSCAPLQEMQTEIKNLNPTLISLSLSTVYGLKGAGISLHDLVLGNSVEQPIKAMDAIISLTSDNAQNLWLMLGGAVPELAAIKPDKTPVEVDLPALKQLREQYHLPRLYVALKGPHLLAYVGETAAKRVAQMNSEGSASNGLLYESVNYTRLSQLLGEAKEKFWADIAQQTRMPASACLMVDSMLSSISGIQGDFNLKSHFSQHGWSNDVHLDIRSSTTNPSVFSPVGDYTVNQLHDGCTFLKDGQESIRPDGTGTYQRFSDDEQCIIYETEYQWQLQGSRLKYTYNRSRSRIENSCHQEFEEWSAVEDSPTQDQCLWSPQKDGFLCTYAGEEPYQYQFVRRNP